MPDKKCPPPDSFTENYFSFSDDSDSDVVGTPIIENLVEGMGLQLYPEQNPEDLVAEFKCSCKYNKGEPCSTNFNIDILQQIQLGFMELSLDELDTMILSKLSCGMHIGTKTSQSRKKHQSDRKAQRTDFYHHGFQICRDTFKYMHSIGQDKLNNLIKHYKENGVQPHVHKNSKCRPRHALKLEDTRAVVDFIFNFAEANCIILPGRAPRHWKTDVKLLPSNCSKRTVYESYCTAVELTGIRKVALLHSVICGKHLYHL